MPTGPYLMGRYADGVNIVERERDATEGLHGVRVHERAGRVSYLRNLYDGLNDAGLVVRGHDRDERCSVVYERRHRLGRDDPVAVWARQVHVESTVPQCSHDVELRVMLYG